MVYAKFFMLKTCSRLKATAETSTKTEKSVGKVCDKTKSSTATNV
jgi:hypothetical protein